MMRPQHIDNHSVASIRPNCSESSMHTDQSTISVIPSHLINLGHSPQIMLQQQHQQQVQQQPLYSTPILQSPLNIIQTELIRSGLQNSNLISSNPASLGFRRLLAEMRAKQFDAIRFAAYRTASKLRFIQQRTLFNIMDLWKVVETFREFGLHHLNDPQASLDYAGTFRLLSRIYSYIPTSNLNVKNPTDDTQSGNTVDRSVLIMAAEILLGWLGYAFDLCATGRLSVTGLKIALSTLTNARPAEKFRYHFTLLSDPSGALIFSKFEAYLQDLLKLPISVFEGTNFFYTPRAAQIMFTGRSKNIVLEEFLDRMLSDQAPQVLVWLTIFHRLASVANVRHNVRCEGCKREQICGLRYKCTRCPHYNLCQDCFWIGVTTDQHTNAHDVKEYNAASKSHSRQFGHSLRKSFQFGRSITNPVSSSTMTTGGFSEPKTPTAVSVPRRILLRSIFEWNSGPTTTIVPNSCTDGTIQPLNMPVDVVATSSIACPSKQLSNQRFVAPVNSICSPLPNRRLQQLNPLFMSTGSTNDIPDLSCMSTQPMQVVPLFNRMTELDQGSNSVTQNVIATTCYNNTIQQQDKIAANYTRAGSGLPHSKAPSVNQHCSHESHLSGTTHRVPISCHCQPTTDVLPIDISRQPQQQQQISSSLLTPSTTQTAPIVSVYNDSFVTSSMGTSFSLRAYNVNQKSNEEHNLIARYAAQLAAASALNQEFDKLGDFVDSTQTQKQLIAQLQEKNRKILKEIERLRIEQQKQAAFIAAAGSFKHDSFELQDLVSEGAGTLSPTNLVKYVKADNLGTSAPTNLMIAENPRLFADLQALRQRKDELESRMNNLQRSRTDLMLQLEALVRLLSVSSGPTNLQENNTSLPIDPPRTYDSGDICRSGHKSRMDQKLPEYPPRRSTSLCHPSVGRNVPEKFFPTVTPSESRYDVGDGNHQKPSSCDAVRKNVSPLKTVSVAERGGQWNLKFFEDKKHELHSPSSVTSRHSVEIDPQRTSDNLLEKYKDLLYKGANAQPVASKSLKLHSGGRRPYLGAFQTEEKTVLFNHNSTNVIRLSSNHSSHQTNHSDSGSDAYLYSDPELCFTITSMTCPSQSGVSTLQAAVQLSPLPSASTVVSKSSKTSRDLLGCLSDKTVTTTPIVDNYEYAGSHPCSVPPLSYFQDEHVRHRRNNTLSIPATTNL